MSRRAMLIVLAAGTGTMSLQMLAVRMLAPAVGASSVVWATIIGLSLVAMSGGYAIGGRHADDSPSSATLVRSLGVAAVLTVLIVPVIEPLTRVVVAIESDVYGAGVGFLVTVMAPLVLLGMTPPMVIRRLTSNVATVGSVAGRVYATSTVGSILGTLLTSLLLVQWVGTRASLVITAGVLAVGAVAARGLDPEAEQPVAVGQARDGTDADRVDLSLACIVLLAEGFAMMATEMAIARLVAPFFGASHAVWAVIIATVMGSIAVGSRLGGRLADRDPTLRGLVATLGWAAATIALLPLLAMPVMRPATGGIASESPGVVVAAFLTTMLLLVVPVLLLGMVPPRVIRLTVPSLQRAGRTTGLLYATSTVGALIGTWSAALLLIPTMGTRRTFALVAALLVLLAVLVARKATWISPRSLMRIGGLGLGTGVAIIACAASVGVIRPASDGVVLAEHESRYQFIQVVADHGSRRRYLQLNEGWAVHSIWDPNTVLVDGIWDHFLLAPAMYSGPVRPHRMAVLGSAAGTARRAFATVYPDLAMTSVELDPTVTRVGRRWFDLQGRVVTADARPFLARSRHARWDLIHVDAYRQPYIPFYLTTREFFELARSRLTAGGVLSINVGSTPEDPRINEAVAATLRDVFPYVARYRAERYNELIIAVDDPDITTRALRERIASSDVARGLVGGSPQEKAQLQLHARQLERGLRPVGPRPSRVMTDDRAPVEWMTDRMIFGAVR